MDPENTQVTFELRDGVTYMIIDHDKGRSVYALAPSHAWVPVDGQSAGAMLDLVRDLRTTSGVGWPD